MEQIKSSTGNQAEVRSRLLYKPRPYCGLPTGDYQVGRHSGSFHRTAIEMLRASVAGWLYRRPLLYGLLRESRNYLRRIAAPAELRAAYRHPFGDLSFGPVFEEVETRYLRLCMKTQACIRDTQQSTQIKKSDSLLDLQLFVAGWKQGAEWGLSEVRNRDSAQSSQPD